MVKLSTSQVAKLTKKSKPTILRLYNNGKLSGERKEDNSVFFDSSEVLRFFTDLTQKNIDDMLNGKPNHTVSKYDNEALNFSLQIKEKEIENLEQKVEFLEKSLQKSESDKQEIKEEKKKLLDMLERKDLLLEDMRLKTEIKPVEKRKKIFGIF